MVLVMAAEDCMARSVTDVGSLRVRRLLLKRISVNPQRTIRTGSDTTVDSPLQETTVAYPTNENNTHARIETFIFVQRPELPR